MSHKTPIFSIPQPQHFSDYGFDPQIDYFQVLEEARKHKTTRFTAIDTLHFKLQKPISRDESWKKIKKNNKKRWWKNALHFFKWTLAAAAGQSNQSYDQERDAIRGEGSISGPIYVTESRSGSSTPYRTTSRPTSGPLAGSMSPAEKGEMQIPYISLRDINVEQNYHRMSTSAMPIYLVT